MVYCHKQMHPKYSYAIKPVLRPNNQSNEYIEPIPEKIDTAVDPITFLKKVA